MHTDATSRRSSLWFAFLAGPLAWSVHETLSYALVKLACSSGLLMLVYIVTVGCLALAGVGLYVAIRLQHQPHSPETAFDFVSATAILVDAMFAFAIVMEAIPLTLVSPCL
jgi:hypothetical protein